MYYEITLNWNSNNFTVNPDKGEEWAMDTDIIAEAAGSYPVEEVSELPLPLENSKFPGLRLFRVDGQHGPAYFGIYED